MSTRKTWAIKLAARARRLGWEVVRHSASGGYKIHCPDNFVVQLHLTSSDVNAERTAERLLNEHGFAEAEARLLRRKEKEKAGKIAADKAAARQLTAKLAAQSRATAKAAGPYAPPELVDASWFLTAHPAPWMRWVIMEPELAAKLLAELNTSNRPISRRDVDDYKTRIVAGEWRLTHQGIAVDRQPVLQDGQHRLQAIAEVGIAVPMAAFVGMDPENFKHIDEGRLRRAGQLLARDGEHHTVTLAATIRLIAAFGAPSPRRALKERLTMARSYDVFASDADALREAVEWGRRNYSKMKVGAAPLAAARYVITGANGDDNPYVEAFFNGLLSGLKGDSRMALDADDPRLRLRDWLFNKREKGHRMNGLDQLALIVKAWNYTIDDVRPRYLRMADDIPIPQVKTCTPHGANPSAPPPLLRDEVNMLARRADGAAA